MLRIDIADLAALKRFISFYCKTKITNLQSETGMNQFDSSKDFYTILGAREDASQSDIERLYKRLAVRLHPDRGGDEDEMKSLNEAYAVLRDESTRYAYDSVRRREIPVDAPPQTAPAAQISVFTGQWVGALLFLGSGLTLVLLVRFQWIWFLWPLAILAVMLIIFGVALAHAAVQRLGAHRVAFRRWLGVTLEVTFWLVVLGGGYGIYRILS